MWMRSFLRTRVAGQDLSEIAGWPSAIDYGNLYAELLSRYGETFAKHLSKDCCPGEAPRAG